MITVTNTKALSELLDLVKHHADLSPWYWRDDGEGGECRQCLYCASNFSEDDDVNDPDDETLHEPGCLWRLIKETYANLTNEGY